MKQDYIWVPWFSELARKISENGEQYLIEKSKEVNWINDEPPLLAYEDKNIDPFSFFYFLASKMWIKEQETVYSSVHEVFEMKEKCPGESIIPAIFTNNLFHNGKIFRHVLLWNLFHEAVDNEKTIDQQKFKNVLDIPEVGVSKLTQCLFLINPVRFFPVDKRIAKLLGFSSVRALHKEINSDGGFERYKSILKDIGNFFPGCEFPEINQFLYLISLKELLIKATPKFFQVSSNVYNDREDWWESSTSDPKVERTFKESSHVFTGGPGVKKKYPLSEPKRGDVVLVRYGKNEGRGIGVVNENEYLTNGIIDSADRFNENAVIHVYWINKSSAGLAAGESTPILGFSKAGAKTQNAFRLADSYKRSFDLIEIVKEEGTKGDPPSLEPGPNGSVTHSLNTILYGPPGTGKTFHTSEYCVEICDGQSDRSEEEIRNRYRQLIKEKRVEFVTFHQSYGYEEFVEGLRPKPGRAGSAGFRLVPTTGVLKRIAKRARKNSEESYVLVIDEINRANVSKVLGELVTLLEDDKREGADNEVNVTLPYSGVRFTLPRKLYILGTMNTADRSIALLDTALRRRFEFKEMPPEPELLSEVSESTGIELPAVLGAINTRLEWLLDRDHLIGHAWLMRVNSKADVDRIMRHKIIPLIAEYFYDDWNKVQAVLGGGDEFVRKESLSVPPNLEGEGEERYRWTIQKDFSGKAYDRLIAGKELTKESQSE